MMAARPNRWKRAVVIFAFLAVVATGPVWGQSSFGLSVTSAPNPVLLTQPLTYLLSVTNLSSFQVTDVFVTNRFSASALFVSSSNSLVATVTTNTDDITFRINSLPGGQVVDWRKVFRLSDNVSLAEVERAYRERIETAHPDKGGTAEEMAELNAARAAARRELAP